VQISNLNELKRLGEMSDLDSVRISVGQLRYHGVLRIALRRALHALKLGGEIVLADFRDARQGIEPFRFPDPTVRSLAITSLHGEAENLGFSDRVMRFRRTAPIAGPGWSAGIVFSGSEDELPRLKRCLDSLKAQPELVGAQGEIVVCGPEAARGMLADDTAVRYLSFEALAGQPFPISRKKNHLLAHMRFPRRLVLHTRISLAPDTLRHAPREFDILGLDIRNPFDDGTSEPGIGYVAIDAQWPELAPSRFSRTTRHVAPGEHLRMLRHRLPYVDGGAFLVMDKVSARCPLHDGLHWAEAEDVEWCFRAQALGYSIDMAPSVVGYSERHKARRMASVPAFVIRPVQAVLRAGRWLSNAISMLRHR